MYDLRQFGPSQQIESGRLIRALGRDAETMEFAAGRLTDFFYDNFIDLSTREPHCSMVRCFKTHPYGLLPEDLRECVRGYAVHGYGEPESSLSCLCLLASRGDRPHWNGRVCSRGHGASPMNAVHRVGEGMVVESLLRGLGFGVTNLVGVTGERFAESKDGRFDVFLLEEPKVNSSESTQELFARPSEVRSVLGFGGVLPSGEFVALVMFSKMALTRASAEGFRALALGAKLALLPFAAGQVFHVNQ